MNTKYVATAPTVYTVKAGEAEVTSEPVLAEDLRVWRDPKSGRLAIGIRAAGLGLVAWLEPSQADALAAAVMDVIPIPHETPDLSDSDRGWW